MKTIFTLMLSFCACVMLHAQEDTLYILGGQANAGLLETTINNDKDESGNRKNPNRVYKLEKDQLHFQLAAINVENPNGTLRIVGETGGKKPVIIPITTNDIGVGVNLINGSLELKNVHYQAMNEQGGFTQDNESQWELNGLNRKLLVEDCLFEFTNFQLFMANAVTEGLEIEMRNNYFRDLFWDQQWWASRVFQAKVPIDRLIFENNTVSGSGMALLQQEALTLYALINHNTFINNHAYPIINNYYWEAYFTNNLFYNTQTKGEDFTVISLEPDQIPTDIIGIDTITTNILVQAEVLADENTLAAPYNDIGNYIFYAADNIYFNQAALDPYYNGEYNDIFDAPVSYLNWFGDGPHKVEVPTPFMNSRAKALSDGWPNIVYENNILDQDPGLKTVAISAADAEQHAIWNRTLYGVAEETRTADMSGWYFGDNDPSTIPGFDTEDGDGITKFTDLIEDFSFTENFTSKSDGYTIGALHWTNEINAFDKDASLNNIKKAYEVAILTDGLDDTLYIVGGQANAGLLEATINNDKDESGNRNHPNRVYKLEKDQLHFQLAAINVENPNGTLRIVGETGGKKPVIIPITTNDIGVGVNLINGSLELKNVHYQAMNEQGGFTQDNESQWELNGLNRKLLVEDCLFEFTNFQLFMANAVTEGLEIEMRNNYFRDLFWDQQWWASRVFQAKVPIDRLIFENNTVSGSGMALLQQEALTLYALINHNTFINNHAYPIINNYYWEAYFTNNLFYNTQTKGEDFTVISLEPDQIPTDIIGIDTITTNILVQAEVLADENTLAAPYNDIGNYIFYAADNIYFNQAALDPYYNGEYNDIFDAPVSYLNWFGDGPHKVEVPTPFMNSRAKALSDGWPNIVYENNILDQDPGLKTVAISAADAEQHAIWNRTLYGVAEETRTADMSGWYFGDNDPSTIPGIETEDGDGITKFTDLIEDFSITENMKSKSDGYTIGALHWTNEIDGFNQNVSLGDILAAYQNAVDNFGTDMDTTEVILSVNDPSDFQIKNYPNPFQQKTTIKYYLKNTAHAKITIRDISGKEVVVLVDKTLTSGSHEVMWDASSYKSGLYFYTLEAEDFTTTKKMFLIK